MKKEVNVQTVRERIDYIEALEAKGVGTKIESQQFELACLRQLLAALAAACAHANKHNDLCLDCGKYVSDDKCEPPAAPVMQPVRLPRPYGMQDHDKWLKQSEVIDAIRAAGYPVEGE